MCSPAGVSMCFKMTMNKSQELESLRQRGLVQLRLQEPCHQRQQKEAAELDETIGPEKRGSSSRRHPEKFTQQKDVSESNSNQWLEEKTRGFNEQNETSRRQLEHLEDSHVNRCTVATPNNLQGEIGGHFMKIKGAANDYGIMYEIKMILLVFLRCLATGGNFQLASNQQGVGKFDDIVIIHEDLCNKICLQLKHKMNPVSLSNIVAFEGNFSILSYFKSYRDEVHNTVNENCTLTFYTNAGFPKELFQFQRNDLYGPNILEDYFLSSSENGIAFYFTEENEDIYNLTRNIAQYERFLMELLLNTDQSLEDLEKYITNEIINFTPLNSIPPFSKKLEFLKKKPTSKNIQILLLEVKKLGDLSLYHDFLQKFRVYCRQVNVQQLDEVIKVELRRITGLCNTDVALEKLITQIKYWREHKEGHYLTRTDPIWCAAIKEMFKNLSETKLNEVISHNIRVKKAAVNKLKELISKNQVLHIFVNGEYTLLATCKIYQALEERENMIAIFVSLKSLLCDDSIISAWASMWGSVLVLEADTVGDNAEKVICTLRNTLQQHQRKKLIVITNINEFKTVKQVRILRGEHYLEQSDKTNLTDLLLQTQNSLTQVKVTFQGEKILLHDLVDHSEDLKMAVDEAILMKILKGIDIKIGKNLHEPTNYFVPRTLSCPQDKSYQISIDNLNNFHDRVVVVIGSPGMGKTTLMTYLAKKIKAENPYVWVILVNLREHTSYLDNVKEYIRGTTAIEFLKRVANLNSEKITYFEKCIFDHSWQTSGRIVLLMDGFDEICPIYEQLLVQIINDLLDTCIAKLWITSRPISRELLERTVKSKAFYLDSLSESHQKMLLLNEWHKEFSDEDIEMINNFINKIFHHTESLKNLRGSFAAIPLHAQFLAKILKVNLNEFLYSPFDALQCNVNIINLFEEFFHIKCEESLKKKGFDTTMKGVKEVLESFKQEAYRVHSVCALVSLLQPSDLQRLDDETIQTTANKFLAEFRRGTDLIGVIQTVSNEKPVFVHETLAHYLAAKWFAEHFEKNIEVIRDIMQKQDFHTVLEMLTKIQSRNSELHNAIINNDKKSFKSLLEIHYVNATDSGGRTALHVSAFLSAEEYFTKLLLEHGADLKVVDSALQWTPLQYADSNQMWNAVGLLMQSGGNVADLIHMKQNMKQKEYIKPALRISCEYGYKKCLDFLFKEGVSVDMPIDDQQHRPIHIVANCIEIPLKIENNGLTSLTMEKSKRLLDFLLKYGANVNAKSSSGKTILHLLAEAGNWRLLQYVTERKMDESGREKVLGTERLFNVLEGKQDVINRQKVMTQCRDNEGRTALDLAAYYKHEQVAKYLYDTRFAFDGFLKYTDKHIENPQLLSAVRLLVEERGADIRKRNDIAKSPLHYACKTGDLNVVEYIIGKGADIHARDKYGYTPLYSSIQSDVQTNIELVTYLVKMGALTNITNVYGDSPLHTAAYHGKIQVLVFLLEQCGNDPNIQGYNNMTPLHRACMQGHLDIVKYLVEKHNMDPNVMESKGNTPLDIARSLGSYQYLVDYLEPITSTKQNSYNNVFNFFRP